MYKRKHLKQLVQDRLGDRDLVWAGLRGSDAEPLADIEQFRAVLSIIDRYGGRIGVDALAYEDLSGRRVDLEIWDIDDHPRDPETETFRRRLLSRLARPSALVPYRPSNFLSAAAFGRSSTCLHLGIHGAHQQAFEHKPWIETLLADTAVPMIPWQYVSDEDRHIVHGMLERGPVVIRRSRTSGGEGIVRIDDPDALETHWMATDEHFLSVAPFIDDTMPLNIAGTVWHDGVTVHLPSFQIIGVESCVTRTFGYCGNDFAATAVIEPEVLDRIEAHTRRIGELLRRHGYLGTYGVDFLLQGDIPYFMEINPRFQGSTPLASRLAIGMDRSDLLLEHVAAFLGIDAPESIPIAAAIVEVSPASQLMVHALQTHPAPCDVGRLHEMLRDAGILCALEIAPGRDTAVDEGAAICRLRFSERITTTGFEIDHGLDTVIRDWHNSQGQGGTKG